MPRSPETQAALNCARSTIKCALELPYGFGTKDIERGILAAARAFMRSATTAEIEMMRTKNVPARLTKEECIDLYKDPTKHIMAAAAASAPRGEGRCLSSKAYDVYRKLHREEIALATAAALAHASDEIPQSKVGRDLVARRIGWAMFRKLTDAEMRVLLPDPTIEAADARKKLQLAKAKAANETRRAKKVARRKCARQHEQLEEAVAMTAETKCKCCESSNLEPPWQTVGEPAVAPGKVYQGRLGYSKRLQNIGACLLETTRDLVSSPATKSDRRIASVVKSVFSRIAQQSGDAKGVCRALKLPSAVNWRPILHERKPRGRAVSDQALVGVLDSMSTSSSKYSRKLNTTFKTFSGTNARCFREGILKHTILKKPQFYNRVRNGRLGFIKAQCRVDVCQAFRESW